MPGQPMLVHLDDEEAERTAEVSGAIDVFSSALLPVRALAGLPETARSLVIDLREVSFVDSAGISALVKLRREAHSRAVEVRARFGTAQSRINATVVDVIHRVLPCED
jgi:anti-anti-sigma factor